MSRDICTVCRTPRREGATFCSNCGKTLISTPAQFGPRQVFPALARTARQRDLDVRALLFDSWGHAVRWSSLAATIIFGSAVLVSLSMWLITGESLASLGIDLPLIRLAGVATMSFIGVPIDMTWDANVFIYRTSGVGVIEFIALGGLLVTGGAIALAGTRAARTSLRASTATAVAHALKVALLMGVFSWGMAVGSRIPGVTVAVEADPLAALVHGFMVAAVFATAGALWSTWRHEPSYDRGERSAPRRVLPSVIGAAEGVTAGLAAVAVGLLVTTGFLAVVTDRLDGVIAAGPRAVIGAVVLLLTVLPNLTIDAFVLLHGSTLELADGSTLGLAFGLPTWATLALVIPASSSLLTGYRAAHRGKSQTRRDATQLGVAAGIAYAVLLVIAAALARFSLVGEAWLDGRFVSGGMDAGFDLWSVALFSIVWGVVGGYLGGWFYDRSVSTDAP